MLNCWVWLADLVQRLFVEGGLLTALIGVSICTVHTPSILWLIYLVGLLCLEVFNGTLPQRPAGRTTKGLSR